MRALRTLKLAVLVGLITLYALYFVHLGADFPDVNRWDDDARMTDEGWYADAAIHHVLTGKWYFPKALNTAVMLPVWPVVTRGWFALWGISMVAERALTVLLWGGSLLLFYVLMRRWAGSGWALAAIAIALVSPYDYAYFRFGLLEPMVLFLFLLALWLAVRADLSSTWRSIAIGVLVALMILTKTSAVALALPLLYALAVSEPGVGGLRNRQLLGQLAVICGVAAVLCLSYFGSVLATHHYGDVQNFLQANARTPGGNQIRREVDAVWDGHWFDTTFLLVSLGCMAASFWPLRRLWRNPVFGAFTLSFVFYVSLLSWRAWREPRYYSLCALPLIAIPLLTAKALEGGERRKLLRIAVLAPLAVSGLLMCARTGGYMLHPRWTFRDAALDVAATMRGSGDPHPVLFGGSGADIALFTGIEAWNSFHPPHGIDPLLAESRPGWYGTNLPIAQSELDAMRKRYTLVEVRRYHPVPDPMRNTLVIYRLLPLPAAGGSAGAAAMANPAP